MDDDRCKVGVVTFFRHVVRCGAGGLVRLEKW